MQHVESVLSADRFVALRECKLSRPVMMYKEDKNSAYLSINMRQC